MVKNLNLFIIYQPCVASVASVAKTWFLPPEADFLFFF